MEMPRTRRQREARIAAWEARMAATRNEWAAKAAEMEASDKAPNLSAKFNECPRCGVWVSKRQVPTEDHAALHDREDAEARALAGDRVVRV
jgi:hypothetical protein